MPVRLGFPVGVKGIVQLVQGPQYATGVGLVRYGASQLADAAPRGLRTPDEERRTEAQAATDAGEQKNGFWNWFRAAF